MAQTKGRQMKTNIEIMLEDDSVSFNDFYTYLRDDDSGDWDSINNEEIIKEYVYDLSKQGISVSHILLALESTPSKEELYHIWLGNSLETPSPIDTKLDLYNALGLAK